MKKILIALDYDSTALKVAEIGFSLAKAMDAEVILLHVMSDPENYSSTNHITIMGFAGRVDMGPLQPDSAEGLINAARYFLEKSKEHLGDKAIQTLVKEGDFAKSILLAAKDTGASIIVMGSHGSKKAENIIMGSVTEKVLKHIAIPLFIVPTRKI